MTSNTDNKPLSKFNFWKEKCIKGCVIKPWVYAYISAGLFYGALILIRRTLVSHPTNAPLQTTQSSFSNTNICHESQIHVVKPWIFGNIISGVIYGALTTIYLMYLHIMRKQYPKCDLLTRQAWVSIGYATLMFVLCTLTLASALKKTITLLDFNLECGSSDAGLGLAFLIPGGAGTMGNICFMLTSWTADALLIWRCLTMYHDLGHSRWLVVSFPLLLQVGSIALGSWFTFILTSKDIYTFMVYYESLTLAQNTILTILIVSRLFVLRHRAQMALGSNFGYEYTTVAAMLVESQAITFIAQSAMLAFVVQVRDSGATLVVYQVLSQVQALSPMLVLYRVIQGKAWSRDVFAQITKSGQHSFGGA